MPHTHFPADREIVLSLLSDEVDDEAVDAAVRMLRGQSSLTRACLAHTAAIALATMRCLDAADERLRRSFLASSDVLRFVQQQTRQARRRGTFIR